MRDIAARAGMVLDHVRLADALGEPGGDDARHDIGRTAGRKRHQPFDGLARPGLFLGKGGCAKECQKKRTDAVHFSKYLPSSSRLSRPRSASSARTISRPSRLARAEEGRYLLK